MNLEELNEEIEKLEGSKESKKAFLKIIDPKAKNDMEKVVAAIDQLNYKLESSIGSLNTKLESSIGSLKSETKIVYWVIGIAMGILIILLTILGLFFGLKK